MSTFPRVMGLIPARAASREIPGKNKILLNGRPLISYTLEAAANAELLTRSIVSTNDPAVVDLAHGTSIDVPFLRPESLAGDDSPMVSVVVHAARFMAAAGEIFDAIALLQPTSPMRTSRHIDDAIRLYAVSGESSLVSVQRLPHRFLPHKLATIGDDGYLSPLGDRPSWVAPLPRQNERTLFARNGPAILVTSTTNLERNQLYGESIIPYEMSPLDSIDIDDDADLAIAEALLQLRSSS